MESGYSLVEVLAAIVILSIAIIPMVAMFDMGLRSATTSGNYDQARALANKQLEEIKALSFTDTRSKYPPSASSHSCDLAPPFECEVKTSYLDSNLQNPVANPATSYLRVEVTVRWDGGSKEIKTTGLKVR